MTILKEILLSFLYGLGLVMAAIMGALGAYVMVNFESGARYGLIVLVIIGATLLGYALRRDLGK